MAFLSSLQLLSPLWLALGIAIPSLVFAYLKKKNEKKKTVSSVIILRSLSTKQTVRRNLKLPIRFFLELLALLLLLLSLTSPTWSRQGNNYAVVIDNSFSMRATEENGESRLQKALNEAKTWINDQSSGSTFSVYSSSPTLRQLGKNLLGKSNASDLLQSISPSYTNDVLEGAVAELGQAGPFDEVFVVSDKLPEYIEDEASNGQSGLFSSVTSKIVGAQRQNVYINNIRIDKSALGDDDQQVLVSIACAGAEDIPIEISLYRLSGEKEQLVDTISGEAVADRAVEFAFDIPLESSNSRLFRANVSTKRSSANAISEDDNAWVTEDDAGATRILLVSSERTSFGSNPIPGIKVDRVSPEQYSNLSPSERSEYALLVFHKTSPSAAPRQSTLLILPPEGNPLFPVKSETPNPSITSWANDHAINSYLRVPLLEPEQSVLFSVPSWAQSVINSERGTIVAAGESRGIRFAATGFELLPFEGARTPVSSILTLNLINWLMGNNALGESTRSGSAIRLAGNQTWIIRDPKNEVTTKDLTDSEPFFYQLLIPGPYGLTNVSVASANRVNRSTQTVVANVFLGAESDTFKQQEYQLRRRYIRKGSAENKLPLWPFLALAALSILAIESIFFMGDKDA